MPTVASLIGAAGVREDIARQLARVAALEWYSGAGALVERAADGGVDAVLTELEDEAGGSIAPTVVALAARAPTLPVLVYDRVNRFTLAKLLAVLTPGLRTECVIRPFEPLAPALRRILSPAAAAGAGPLLLQRFVPLALPALRVFVAIAALKAPSRRGVEQIAQWSGVSARTIERRLRRAGWPSARILLQSFSALDAVWLMDAHGWSAKRVQRVRGFAHESSVTRLLSRYCGCRPATLREDGGLAAALEHVTRLVSSGTMP